MSSNHINIGIVVVPDEVLETMLPTGEYYLVIIIYQRVMNVRQLIKRL